MSQKEIAPKLLCADLIVLGMTWDTSETDLRKYFSAYGDVIFAIVKRDQDGSSKGFGFIRFQKYESQQRVLSKRHFIKERWCNVKIPLSHDIPSRGVPCKLYVGKITEDITSQDLMEHFREYGEVLDVYMPKIFRAFALVTFKNNKVAESLYGQTDMVKSVLVRCAAVIPGKEPKTWRNLQPDPIFKGVSFSSVFPPVKEVPSQPPTGKIIRPINKVPVSKQRAEVNSIVPGTKLLRTMSEVVRGIPAGGLLGERVDHSQVKFVEGNKKADTVEKAFEVQPPFNAGEGSHDENNNLSNGDFKIYSHFPENESWISREWNDYISAVLIK